MSSNEAFSFVTEVNERRSSEKQVNFIKEREADLLERIGASGGGVRNRKPMGPKARLNIAMGSILNLPEDLQTRRALSTGVAGARAGWCCDPVARWSTPTTWTKVRAAARRSAAA